jgi:thiol-disulfide isomerase/thioredoxin
MSRKTRAADVPERFRIALFATAVLLLLPALAHTQSPGPGLRPVAEPLPAPTLDLEDVQGNPFTLDTLPGRVVLVNFWATWCPPCRKEMPALERLSRRLDGSSFQVIGVNVGEDAERIEGFLVTLPIRPGFPMLLDRTGEVSRAWGARVVPTTWVVDLERRMVLGAVGEVDFDSPELVDQILGLMPAPPPSDGAKGPGADTEPVSGSGGPG